MAFYYALKGGGLVLTAKEEKFIQGVVAGLSQRKAYREAYPNSVKWKDTTVDVKASALMKKDEVLVRYNELMEEHKSKALWTREQAVNDLLWLKEQSRQSIISEKFDRGYVRQGTSNAFMSAVQELNKLEDLYPTDKQEIELSGGVQFVDDIETD